MLKDTYETEKDHGGDDIFSERRSVFHMTNRQMKNIEIAVFRNI